jgi:hypothetical protein
MNSYVVLSDDDTFDCVANVTIYQLNDDGENELEQGGFRHVSASYITDSVTLSELIALWNETYGTDF